MISGIGGLGGIESYFGPLGRSLTVSLSVILVFRRFFPGVSYTPNDSRFSWASSNGLLSDRQIEILNGIDQQVFGEPIEMELFERPEPEPEPEIEPEPEQKPEVGEPQPNIPYHDQSLWDLAGKTLSSWLRGLCVNGINLDPKTVRTAADAATVAGGFGAMLFLLYLAKREPKTDYYTFNKVTLQAPPAANIRTKSNRLQELEAALQKLNSAAQKESS